MKYLIIVGNGFDKAHNLRTTYYEFMQDLFGKYFTDKNLYNDILDPNSLYPETNSFEALLNAVQRPFPGYNEPVFYNEFIRQLLIDIAEYKWCEIENKYFDELMNNCNNNFDTRKLNEDFKGIKKYLSDHLTVAEKKATEINSYKYFFNHFTNSEHSSSEAMILNFNYTNTIKKLYSNVIKCPIIHIHGELENIEKPIIFGYGAKDEDNQKLLSINKNNFLENIKNHLYSRAKDKDTLKKFLGSSEWDEGPVNVMILGHSCGLSDGVILNEIFNSKYISSIKIFYYETYEQFNDIQININRILMNNTTVNDLIVNFQDSYRMPQWNDDEKQSLGFIEHIKAMNPPSPPPSPITFI